MRLLSIIICAAGIFASSAANSELLRKALEMEKEIFISGDSLKISSLIIEKSRLYKNAGEYSSAIKNLDRLNGQKLPAETYRLYLYEKALNYFLLNNYFGTQSVLNTLAESVRTENENEKMLQCLVYTETGDWKNCKELLLKDTLSLSQDKRSELLSLPVSIKRKNPYTARTYSSLIPGAGQFYAGYPVKGLTSLSLTAGLGAFIIYNSVGGFYVTAFATGFIPLSKFYKGGIEYAEKLCIQHNEKLSHEMQQRYKEIIFSTYYKTN